MMRDAVPNGYMRVFADKGLHGIRRVGRRLGIIAPSILWILMPVYANTNFGVPEAAIWMDPHHQRVHVCLHSILRHADQTRK